MAGMRSLAAASAGILLVLVVSTGPAGALRCGSDLISEGDRQIEVRHACGEPASIEEWSEVRHAFRWGRFWPFWEEVRIEEWTYNFGPSRFLYTVRFENGRVKEVESGNYGF